MVNQEPSAYAQTGGTLSAFNSGSIALPGSAQASKQLPPRAKSNYRSHRADRVANSKASSKYQLVEQSSMNLASIDNDLYQTQISQPTRSSRPENLIIRSTRGLNAQHLTTNSSKNQQAHPSMFYPDVVHHSIAPPSHVPTGSTKKKTDKNSKIKLVQQEQRDQHHQMTVKTSQNPMNINTGLQSDINSSLKNLCFTRNTRANKDTIELGSLNSSSHQQALQGYSMTKEVHRTITHEPRAIHTNTRTDSTSGQLDTSNQGPK